MLVSKPLISPVKIPSFNIPYANYQNFCCWRVRLLIGMITVDPGSAELPARGHLTPRGIGGTNTWTATWDCVCWHVLKPTIDILIIIYQISTPELKACCVLPLERLFYMIQGFDCVFNTEIVKFQSSASWSVIWFSHIPGVTLCIQDPGLSHLWNAVIIVLLHGVILRIQWGHIHETCLAHRKTPMIIGV